MHRLDPHLVVIGRVRHRVEGGGFADSAWTWLWTLRDGLVYRSVADQPLDAARDAYARLGVTLGIEGP